MLEPSTSAADEAEALRRIATALKRRLVANNSPQMGLSIKRKDAAFLLAHLNVLLGDEVKP